MIEFFKRIFSEVVQSDPEEVGVAYRRRQWRLRYRTTDDTGTTEYLGFIDWTPDALEAAEFLAVVEIGDTEELWLVEDREGLANLREFYTIEESIAPRMFLFDVR